MMSLTKRVAAATAVVAALAAAGPVTASHAAVPGLPGLGQPDPNLCLHGFGGGAFGPAGPYGPSGPYGPDGPMHGYANPIGNAAECGGFLTYALRGGTVSSYVDATIHPTPAP